MRLFKIKQLILTSLILAIISIYPSTIMAQTVAVTGTITDTQSTPYSNGLLTVAFVNTTGQQATFGGNPSFQKSYSIYLDANGAFTISLPPNSTASPSIQPSGTQWNFSYQSQGGYGAANINVTITGAGSISGTLSNLARITWPYGNIPPPGAAGQGIVFVSSTRLGWGTTGGAGTVTHTAGNLTLNSMMLGNGVADAKVDSACVTDGAGALSGCTSINTPGTVTGNIGSYNSTGTNLIDVACAAQSVSSASQDRFYCDGTNWPVVSMNTNAAQKLALSMGVNAQTVSYLATQSDCGKLITMNGVSLTFTLPAAIINSACVFDVKNLAATSLTISRNGLNVDGAASNPTALTQNQSYRITNDGAGYWTEILTAGSTGTVTSVATTAPITGGTFTTTGTIACATCVTSAAAETLNAVVIGGGLQATSTIAADTTTTHALFATANAPAFRALAPTDFAGGAAPTLDQIGNPVAAVSFQPTVDAGILIKQSNTTNTADIFHIQTKAAAELFRADSAGTLRMGNGGTCTLTSTELFCGTGTGIGANRFNSGPSDHLLISATAPTISSGFGTGASITANNGTGAFRIGVGTSNTGNGIIGLPTASTGWNCYATDITTKSTSVAETLQTASTTTTATLQNYSNIIGTGAWVDSDVLAVSCFAY